VKQKKTNIYILLVAVIVIWSAIGYKLFFLRQTHPVVEVAMNPMNPIGNTIDFERFEIRTAYRDPFFAPIQNKPRLPHKKKRKMPKSEVLFPEIKYIGLLKSEDVFRFLIEIDRQQYFFGVQDTFKDVTLIKGSTKQITVVYQSQKKTYDFKERL